MIFFQKVSFGEKSFHNGVVPVFRDAVESNPCTPPGKGEK